MNKTRSIFYLQNSVNIRSKSRYSMNECSQKDGATSRQAFPKTFINSMI